jgi:mRNA interferase HigB
MRIVSRKTLREFWVKHPAAQAQLRAWYAIALAADWRSPADVKATFGNASIVAGNRVVFNIKGNDYRLIVKMAYGFGKCWVRFVGTHSEYNRVDAAKI